MWSSSRNDHLNKGFVLPLTLILLTFGSLMVFIAGIQVSRTADKINSYNIVVDQQTVALNVVELAAYLYFNEFESGNKISSWDGLEEFKDYVKNRGGMSGSNWYSYLNNIDENSECINFTDTIFNYKTKEGFGQGKYEIEAYIYGIENDKLIIGVTNRNGRKRYSIGLLSRVLIPGIPAARLGTLPKILEEMNIEEKKNNVILIGGDLIYGSAIILDDIYLKTENATPLGIITPSLEASGIYVNGEPKSADDYPSWFTETSTENASVITESWKEEHLSSLPDASITSYINSQNTLPSPFNGDTLYIIDASTTTDNVYELYFEDAGLTITYGENKLYIPSEAASPDKIHLQINGDVVFINDKRGAEKSDPKKVSKINGKYSITVKGSIEMKTNLVYSEIFHKVTNKKGESEVLNHSLDDMYKLINDLINLSSSELDLVSIGGDISLVYGGVDSHGMKFLSGNIMAFEENGIGGNIEFFDIEDAIPEGEAVGHTSQFFVFGSLTANKFDENKKMNDFLKSLVLVANSSSDNSSGLGGELQLLAMRTW